MDAESFSDSELSDIAYAESPIAPKRKAQPVPDTNDDDDWIIPDYTGPDYNWSDNETQSTYPTTQVEITGNEREQSPPQTNEIQLEIWQSLGNSYPHTEGEGSKYLKIERRKRF